VLVFAIFDFTFLRRQEKVMAEANRTNAIVSSLFPSTVRDRLLNEAQAKVETENKKTQNPSMFGNKHRMKTFLNETGLSELPCDSKPIAVSFPAVTVMVRIITNILLASYSTIIPNDAKIVVTFSVCRYCR